MKNFLSSHRLLSVLLFSVVYQILFAIITAHAFQFDDFLPRSTLPSLCFLFAQFSPVIWAFFQLPISSRKKLRLTASLLSIFYIPLTFVFIFITGILLKSDVHRVDSEKICVAIRKDWVDGYDLDASLKQLDERMSSIGAKFVGSWGVKNGYELSYDYTYDIRGIWGKIFNVKNFISITVTFVGKRDAEKTFTDIKLEELYCRPPFWKASWGYGKYPSKETTYPPIPSERK